MIIQAMNAPVSAALAALPLGITALPHLGVIRAHGDDAASFLQGQLTQDVVLMKPGETRLAAFCNAKGRTLASFWVLKTAADELLLVTSADTLAATLKRLSMFVLRARLKLSDATADFALWGQLGEASVDPDGADQGLHRLSLRASGDVARTIWLAPAGSALPEGVPAIDESDWLRAEVLSGIARITRPVVEAFVPQMLNYESVGGVNFKKGCYPGQEVVARSQFRGAIKRRAYLAHVAGPAQAGDEVFSGADPEQPVGLIAQAAAAPQGGSSVIAVLQVAEAGSALRLGGADGSLLSDVGIPYALVDDI